MEAHRKLYKGKDGHGGRLFKDNQLKLHLEEMGKKRESIAELRESILNDRKRFREKEKIWNELTEIYAAIKQNQHNEDICRMLCEYYTEKHSQYMAKHNQPKNA